MVAQFNLFYVKNVLCQLCMMVAVPRVCLEFIFRCFCYPLRRMLQGWNYSPHWVAFLVDLWVAFKFPCNWMFLLSCNSFVPSLLCQPWTSYRAACWSLLILSVLYLNLFSYRWLNRLTLFPDIVCNRHCTNWLFHCLCLQAVSLCCRPS